MGRTMKREELTHSPERHSPFLRLFQLVSSLLRSYLHFAREIRPGEGGSARSVYITGMLSRDLIDPIKQFPHRRCCALSTNNVRDICPRTEACRYTYSILVRCVHVDELTMGEIINIIFGETHISYRSGQSHCAPREEIFEKRDELPARLNHDPRRLWTWCNKNARLPSRWQQCEERPTRLDLPSDRREYRWRTWPLILCGGQCGTRARPTETEGIDPLAFIGAGRGADKIIWRCLATNNSRTGGCLKRTRKNERGRRTMEERSPIVYLLSARFAGHATDFRFWIRLW